MANTTIIEELKKSNNWYDGTFEQAYLKVRDREDRLYTDEQVMSLPEVPVHHIHFREWQLRKRSAERLVDHLKSKERPLRILEVGCGNGWLTSMLADIPHATVVGVDINSSELQQAANVFRRKANLSFEYGDLREAQFAERKYDIIVFAASMQYFQSLTEIVDRALRLLEMNGEVHVLDTPLYKDEEARMARQRSMDYYDKIGCPEMGTRYFHHSWSGLSQFDYPVLYDPTGFMNQMLNRGPFYWLSITPDD